ncbi:MAG: transporter substrate-binding domain-containing protein [Gammaproteobacteria bacterium]|nr:transporter substrate-binding domain-containing protein [Gammaproteobacteria bacterium]
MPAASDTITLRADVWCPYNCEPESDNPGYMIELAKLAFEKAGHKVSYRQRDWKEAIADSRAGKYTGIVGASRPDAPDFVFPEESLGRSRSCFFTNPNDSWSYSGPASITANMKVATISGYAYGAEIDGLIAKFPERFKTMTGQEGKENPLAANIIRLWDRKVNALVDDRNVVLNTLGGIKAIGKLREAGCAQENSEVYIAFSPKHPKAKEYAQLLSNAVTQARQNGTLKAILAKYGLTDWK